MAFTTHQNCDHFKEFSSVLLKAVTFFTIINIFTFLKCINFT